MTASDRVRVVVVDDSAPARTAIESAVTYAEEFEIVAAAASGEEALAIVPRVDPDLVLLDYRMSGLDGLETSRLLRARGTRAVIVLVSAFRRPQLPDYVDSCGVAAVLHKSEVSPRRLSRLWSELQAGRHAAVPDSA
jgi:two-component system, chemotaxis family, protein-glutamate methylesterase/glutaminase